VRGYVRRVMCSRVDKYGGGSIDVIMEWVKMRGDTRIMITSFRLISFCLLVYRLREMSRPSTGHGEMVVRMNFAEDGLDWGGGTSIKCQIRQV
jgi:hypothetical protein